MSKLYWVEASFQWAVEADSNAEALLTARSEIAEHFKELSGEDLLQLNVISEEEL